MIIDAHVHGPGRGIINVLTAEDMLKKMDENSLDAIVTHPILWGAPGVPTWKGYEEANKIILDASKKHPEKIIGFVRINPHYIEKSTDYLEKAVKEKGASGLKLHPRNEAYPLNSERLVHPLMEKVAELEIPMITHSGDCSFCTPCIVSELAESFPDVTIIMGHMGGTRSSEAIYFAKKSSNIVLETSFDKPLSVLKNAIDSVGPERVVFGSDLGGTGLPHSPKLEVKRFNYLGLSEEEKELVMGRSMARILGKEELYYD
jgi:predicted TIM-barrel fold metal-dependent hydrolase